MMKKAGSRETEHTYMRARVCVCTRVRVCVRACDLFIVMTILLHLPQKGLFSKVRQGHMSGERSRKWMRRGRSGVKEGKC